MPLIIKPPGLPLFIEKEILAQVLSGEFCEISKTLFLTGHSRWLSWNWQNSIPETRSWDEIANFKSVFFYYVYNNVLKNV